MFIIEKGYRFYTVGKKIRVELEQKRRESTAEDPDSPTSSLHHQRSQKRKSFRQISIDFISSHGTCVRARSLNNSQQATVPSTRRLGGRRAAAAVKQSSARAMAGGGRRACRQGRRRGVCSAV
jgi:hypothetical protein